MKYKIQIYFYINYYIIIIIKKNYNIKFKLEI